MDLNLLKQSLSEYQVGSEAHSYILEMIELFTPKPLPVKQDVKTMTRNELLAEYRELCAIKAWSGRYFELDREIQSRATREWVHDDVFGNTFAPLDTNPR